MKIHFEPNLQFQQDAIHSTVQLFDGSSYIRPEDTVFHEVSPNILTIDKKQILDNFQTITQQNQIENPHLSDELDFSIEMETGTGKTYVYLRTILELHKTYGLSKFIIAVPSIPVKEGVLKTLEMTQDHFKQLYNLNVEYFEYNSKKPIKVRQFAISNTLQIMIMNVQAFNTDDRIINQERDLNNGVKLIDLIKQAHPVIIMDEPQVGMDTPNMIKRFAKLEPIFKLRYSATHKKNINLVYQLTPYDAYNQSLVKKIEVFSIHTTNTQSNVQIDFQDIKLRKNQPPQAKLSLNFRLATGEFTTKTRYLQDGDSLENKTNNPVYRGWTINRILRDPLDGTAKIKFSNGTEIIQGDKHGWDKQAIFREQIRWTIRKHFQKKDKLHSQGIKPLSLFFIDKVSNYVESDGIIRQLFMKLYQEEYKSKYGQKPDNIDNIHGGYFAKTKQGNYTDNLTSIRKNKEIYNIIMRDKEGLLSFQEPLEFIFSHSALGVGWDNPNVFNICTLNESQSVTKKRQEIGRGLRICVTQDGKRYRDSEDIIEGDELNLLTIIANQSYYAFASSYQQELIHEYGKTHKTSKLRDASKNPHSIKLNKTVFDSNDFQNLWQKISKKTKFQVVFREQEIIDKCITRLDSIVVQKQTIQTEVNRISNLQVDREITDTSSYIGSDEVESRIQYSPIDLVDELSEQTALSIKTVITILNGLANKDMIHQNPVVYLTEAVKRVKQVLNKEMVRLVDYQQLIESYKLSEFQEEIPTFKTIIPTSRGLYDGIKADSDIEKDFALSLNSEQKVKAFLKLPNWYKISTPIGPYNPDFALVVEKSSLEDGSSTQYYFVVETKGSREWANLKETEKMKIQCAIKHFEAIGIQEYLAPVENFRDFGEQANNITNASII